MAAQSNSGERNARAPSALIPAKAGIQRRLPADRHGFDVGEPDGRFGSRTRDAVRAFQARIGRVPDGFATAGLLKQLMAR